MIKLFLIDESGPYKSQDGGYLWEEGMCEWDGVHGRGFWTGWQSSIFSLSSGWC